MWDREAAVEAADAWIAGYIRAWETNDPDDIRSLFTPEIGRASCRERV